MLQLGPDAPTLCEGWTTRHLAAHLVVRESRPDAAAGIVGGPLSAWTERVTNSTATQPYPELVRKVRTGPPTLSWFSLPGMDGLGNLTEYVVHHEDVRRAQPDWSAREIAPDLADELWGRLRQMARLFVRRVPCGVTLVRTDGDGGTFIAKKGTPMVTVSGTSLELIMRLHGRTATLVEVSGSPEAVAAFEAARISL